MINLDALLLVTILYGIILYIFLKSFFFGPIPLILKKRHDLIEGRQECL